MKTSVKTKNFAVVLQAVTTMDAKVLQAGKIGMERGLLKAVGVVQREFLSGPRPSKLDVRTRRLRDSITSKVTVEGGRVKGAIGSNVEYAAYHEFGFVGTQSVKAHTRVIQQITDTKGVLAEIDNRRVIRDKSGKLIGFKESRKQAAAKQKTGVVGVQFVEAHSRKINYKGRPFVRPAIEKSATIIIGEIEKELSRG